jgi:hypothetical protein
MFKMISIRILPVFFLNLLLITNFKTTNGQTLCENEIKYEFWFGLVVTCPNNNGVYSLASANEICNKNNYLLAEIMDGFLYTNITEELSRRTRYKKIQRYFIFLKDFCIRLLFTY